jgi:hypothetical protein
MLRFVLLFASLCWLWSWETAALAQANAAETDQSQKRPADEAAAPFDQQPDRFVLETLVDFPDDALASPVHVSPQHVDAMMQRLKELGVRRVSWGYYGDGHGGFAIPAGCRDERWKNYELTCRQLGNPLKVAVEAGHRHGLEVYAYFKPYETGPALVIPAGSPEARQSGRLPHQGGSLGWLDPFVIRHPDLRIQHRADGLRNSATPPLLRTIRLTKRNDAPTRITKDHLEIWTSRDNYRYQRAQVAPEFSESVENSPREVRDQNGQVLTRKGDAVRVLTLSGLKLREKYLLVTTDFHDGPADFANAGTAMLTAFDEQGREIPGVTATGKTVWLADMINFRNDGLMFDYGWGARSITLDAPNASGRTGFIAYTAGRNKYLPGALCETEPKVQKFWLSCLEEMIAAGVDGVDFREENHSTHTDFPDEYGFNPVVLKRCQGLRGSLLENIARVRGEAYTDFLRKCKRRLSACGKLMRCNLQLDYLRPDPPTTRLPAYPANLRFEWRRWLDEGLMDAAILRFFQLPFSAVFEDKIAEEMIALCRQRNIPICVNRYVAAGGANLPAEIQRVIQDGRFSGFIFYETGAFVKLDASGGCSITFPAVQEAAGQKKGDQD